MHVYTYLKFNMTLNFNMTNYNLQPVLAKSVFSNIVELKCNLEGVNEHL